MKKYLKNIPTIKKDKKNVSVVLLCLLIIAWVYIYNTSYYLVIRFNELGPITKNMAVYYNGFKVGKIISIEPDDDFKHTLVKVNLYQKNLKLPRNTTVNLESFPNGELYLQFIYPQSPALKTIKRGDMLEGISPYSLEEFMLGQNISGVTDIVSIHVIKALNATEIANMEMSNFFRNTSGLVEENSKGISDSVNNIAAMTKSLAEMSENMNQVSKKINTSLNEKDLNGSTSNIQNTTSNIKDSASNIKETTTNIAKATKDIDKTMQKIDDTVSQVKATAENLNCITSGLNETLSKRGAGMRIMFGTPIRPKR
jgi:ABC-type transporter Mla subunit MlaD